MTSLFVASVGVWWRAVKIGEVLSTMISFSTMTSFSTSLITSFSTSMMISLSMIISTVFPSSRIQERFLASAGVQVRMFSMSSPFSRTQLRVPLAEVVQVAGITLPLPSVQVIVPDVSLMQII